ncbi:Subfamily C ATP-binding cassette [Ignavibacterium album JCM 16511]|uniref:Subfamily C ATP-binding cassette n=1 Tax=Ignavibacterium album (strain DSM 19864 / JCM 16511 / NBRC 101810 / Mat9-16) TaxID=945713 RepID=I0AIK7_IGNAJ|nr:thiol reductant ABC exporter subunit CydC [Ignavibacterium album]AFH48814.1 Subfamily C ATP-binding cassette [Ignavibacterium album JCM 16511]
MFKTFFKIASLSLEYRWWMLLAALMAFFTVGSGIGLMMTSSYIIASAAIQTPIFQLQVAIVGVRFFGISRGIFRYLERYISHEVTFKILGKLRVWFFKSIEPLIPSKKKDLTSGDLLSRSIEDIESLEHIFVRVISPVLVYFAVAVLMFFLLSLFNIKYAIIFLLMFFFSAISIPSLTYLLSKNLGKKIIQLKAQLKEKAVDSIQGLPELIFYEQTEKWQKKFRDFENQLLSSEKKMMSIQSLHESLTGVAMNFTVAILILIAIPDVTDGILNGVYLSVITIGIMASFEIVNQIPLAFQYLGKSVEAGERLLEIINYEKNKIDQVGTIDKKDFTSSIVFSEVSFSYTGKKNVIENLSFEIKKNEIVAVVGESGSGKSTLVNLLTKLWKDYSGKILIDKTDYKNISDESIRDLISVVPQNVHLFTGTIRENLLIAKENSTEDEIYEALKKSELLDFVESLPEKLETNIGELGKKLSGGEIKRLGIARAILRNSPIIIFDEVTEHLDTITEKNILSMIKQLSRDRSILFISHRLNQMEMFDEVIVMSDGRIIEKSKHKDLIEQKGFYYKLLSSQNKKLENLNV